jgi:peptide-methionine (R)-S-oxide reductase
MAKQFSDDELKSKLTPEQYHILREKGTEAPFTGNLLHNKEAGNYICPVCGSTLFSSDTKFDSGSGWPSFYDVASTGAVKLVEDLCLNKKLRSDPRASRKVFIKFPRQ